MALTSTQKRSSIWEYFSVAEDAKFTICSVCSKQVPRGGDNTKSYTTSNIVHHLNQSIHTGENKKYEKLKAAKEKQSKDKQATKLGRGNEVKLKQTALAEVQKLRLPWDINEHHTKFIHFKITEIISLDCQPCSIVDDSSFKVCFRTKIKSQVEGTFAKLLFQV